MSAPSTASNGGGAPGEPGGGGNTAVAVAAGTTGKANRRASGNKSHSRSYPRGVGIDFRKLAGLSLLNYIDHHGTFV